MGFQSTHPVWGGTPVSALCGGAGGHFNPPTPCGVGLGCKLLNVQTLHFNPPTPCGVGLTLTVNFFPGGKFQSTHPVWGGTSLRYDASRTQDISIHPPRVGWDSEIVVKLYQLSNFNPPTPCGVGLMASYSSPMLENFNPPTPCGVGLKFGRTGRHLTAISIHPPRVGWDSTTTSWRSGTTTYFNPPTPCGVGRRSSRRP